MGATPGLRQGRRTSDHRPQWCGYCHKGQSYPTTRDDSEMTADAFSLLGGGVQRQRRKPIQRLPRVSNGIGDRMTQRQGIYQNIYRGLKMAVLPGAPPPPPRFSDLAPMAR